MASSSALLWLETMGQDLRYAVRGLARNPGLSATAVLSLTLGIGASVAIFTVTDSLLLRPLPYRNADRLTMVWELHRIRQNAHNVISPANYFDWKRQNQTFESIAPFSPGRTVLSVAGRVQEVDEQIVSAELLPMLGAQPLRGRMFTAQDDLPGAPNVELISYRLWQTWFNGDESVIGRQVQVNSRPATIIGVMPPDFFFFNRDTDLWETLNLDPAKDYRKSSGRYLLALGLMKPGVTRSRAQADLAAVAARLEAAYPKFDANWTVNVEPLRDSMVREVKTSLLVLLGAVGLLLAVACANVANLLLARYTSRRKEMAVRVALGAARSRVIRQLLTESIVLGALGGVLGLAAAKWAVYSLLALAPAGLTRGAEVSVDLRILFFALGLSILTGVLFGLAPALVTSRVGLIKGLRSDSRSVSGGGVHLRAWFVGAEVALSVILLVGGTLLFRSFVGLQAVDPGLNPTNLLSFRIVMPQARYPEPARRTQFLERSLTQLAQIPGVKSVSAASVVPFGGFPSGTRMEVEGQPPAKPGEEPVTTVRIVMPGYFQTMGIPLLRGRDFTRADNDPSTPYRFIVNQAFVKKHLSGQDPLSSRVSVRMDDVNPFGEIVGVVGDVKEGTLDHDSEPTAYYIQAHLNFNSMMVVLRTESDPSGFTEPIRRAIRSLDAEQPLSQMRTMEAILGETYSRQRFSTVLMSGFSIIALLLAAIGIYGMLAYSVTERTREIGVRVALGAQPGSIVSMIVGSGLRLVAAGTLAGIAGALALSGLLKGLLFGIQPTDVLTYVAVALVLASVAMAAAWIPARRAAKLDPMNALRAE